MKSIAVRWSAALVLLGPALAWAEVTQFVIESRTLLRNGATFGDVGQYERLRAYALGELDPSHPNNAGIVNLDKAPRNSNGRVQYRVDVEIRKPVDLEKGNGTLLYDVVNRGNRLIHDENAVDLTHGFTLVWSAWQGDLARSGDNLIGTFPTARNHDGTSIVGLSRDEYVDSLALYGTSTGTFAGTLTYPAANLDKSQATLTVRERERDARQPITSWQYLNDRRIQITHPGAPYDSGAIFEFIYPAKDPIVAGIGFAATRDVNSFLLFEDEDGAGNPNPLAGKATSTRGCRPEHGKKVKHDDDDDDNGDRGRDCDRRLIKRAMMTGVSQSGRFMGDFLWQGFNQDEAGRKIFDGFMRIVGGARKTWTNFQFAQPGRYSKQHEEHLQPGDQFPFAYNTIRDPLTGKVDGVLEKCRRTQTCPKVFHLDGEYEIWGARGSLLLTDGDPRQPEALRIPSDVRLYMIVGTPHQHSLAAIVPAVPSFGRCKHLGSPIGGIQVIRALIPALNDWLTTGREPPESRYGLVSERAHKSTLVPSDQASTGFPDIPGVTYNGLFNYVRVTDYNVQPPREGAEYGQVVPKVDRDGNSLAGIRLPMLEAPIATYTGWNLRAPGHAEDEMCATGGSYIPFARTASERLAAGDPRLSIEERYRNHDDYVRRFERAAGKLVRERYLLAQDAEAMIEQAKALDIGLPKD